MPTILIACDRPDSAGALKDFFAEAGFHVVVAPARKDLLESDGMHADLVIIDATRDGRRGLCLARRYRSHSSIGIILIHHSGDDPGSDPVAGLDVGADDVLVEPFRLRELLARVNSILRRITLDTEVREGGTGDRRGIGFDGWMLDLEHRQLVATETSLVVPLTASEYDMLMVFLQNPCRVLSREHISMFSHGRPHCATVRTLDAQVARLRKKLARGTREVEYIKSVRSVGYIFCIRTRDVY